jgi:cell division septation protein DedD
MVPGEAYRARFAHLDKEAAETACLDLVSHDMACVVVASPSRAATDSARYPDGYVVLLTSLTSEADARRHARLVQDALEGKFAAVWRREPVVRDAELDDGQVYRGQVGPFRLLDDANRFCRELQFRCTVERTQAQPLPAAR